MKIDVIMDYKRHLTTMELAETTIKDYMRILKLLNDWLRTEYGTDFSVPDSVKGFMISQYCTHIQPMKISSRTLYLTVIKAFLKWLHALQYTDHDLSQAVSRLPSIEKYNAAHPEEVSEKRGYTIEEIRLMLTAPRRSAFVQSRDRAIVAVMLATGLRVSELISLTVGDVIMEPDVLLVPRKGTHGKKVPVSIAPTAYPYIMKYIENREQRQPVEIHDPLWVSNQGKPLNRNQVWHSLSELQKALGIHTGTHTLRHTMITEVTKRANPIAARDAAGQKSISVTNRYLHSTRQEIKEAVDMAGELIRSAVGELNH